MKTSRFAISFAFPRWVLGVERWALSVDCVRSGVLRGLLFAVLLLPLSSVRAQVDEAPYFGSWENSRGETLEITSNSIQVNDQKPVRYDDITEDSDESFFVLQIKDATELSYFGGNFLRITFGKDPDHFTMSIYKALPDALKQQNEVKRIEWSAPAPEEEQKEQPKVEEAPDQKDQQGTGKKKDEETKTGQPNSDQVPEAATPFPTATPSPTAP